MRPMCSLSGSPNNPLACNAHPPFDPGEGGLRILLKNHPSENYCIGEPAAATML